MSKVLTPTLSIPRGDKADVQLQLTIPFIDRHGVFSFNGKHEHTQSNLMIYMGIHNTSKNADCEEPNQRLCKTIVKPYMKHEAEKYASDEWKMIHNITVYNTDNGEYDIDKHIILRFETGETQGTGSKIFEHLILPDIQVNFCTLLKMFGSKIYCFLFYSSNNHC